MSDTSENYSVIYSLEAMDDIREIYSYIAFELQVPDTAEGQINRIRKEIRPLDFMPSRYSTVDWEPWESMKMHKVPVDNFVVYYAVNDENRMISISLPALNGIPVSPPISTVMPFILLDAISSSPFPAVKMPIL